MSVEAEPKLAIAREIEVTKFSRNKVSISEAESDQRVLSGGAERDAAHRYVDGLVHIPFQLERIEHEAPERSGDYDCRRFIFRVYEDDRVDWNLLFSGSKAVT